MASRKLPPMLQAYLGYKEERPDCIILCQVGDFYEAFFEDAVTIAKVLNVTLTSRDKNSAEPIPMAGVPVAVVDSYIDRLVDAGHSVAVVSQSEPAGASKGMVARALDRIVTPGVRLCGASDGESGNPSLAAAWYNSELGEFSIAYTEVQSGKVVVEEGTDLDELRDHLMKLAPTEVVLPNRLGDRSIDRRTGWVRELNRSCANSIFKFRTPAAAGEMSSGRGELSEIEGFPNLKPSSKRCTGLLLSFIDEVTVSATVSISTVEVGVRSNQVDIDAMTARNLDLVRNSRDGGTEGSLYGAMNKTVTAGGGRLLRRWLLNPTANSLEIEARLGVVAGLKNAEDRREQLQSALRYVTDLERIAARLELKIVTPRELGALRQTLEQLPAMLAVIEQLQGDLGEDSKSKLQGLRSSLEVESECLAVLTASLEESLPNSIAEGGVFAAGYSDELDSYREIRRDGKSWMADLEGVERESTGISTLKIKYNNLHGYFIEVTKANLAKVPERYIRKAGTTQVERFVTAELQDLADKVANAQKHERQLEGKLYQEFLEKIVCYAVSIREAAVAIAEIDLLASFGEYAATENLVQPKIVDEPVLEIAAGRHPVLDQVLRSDFIPNSLALEGGSSSFAILTGPNMGGKSTYLRQAALITIMAQIGSFVPADSATVGLVDRIFARLGAADDILEGESTFMVEMREVANIVACATPNSLLLIDEVGRGTATADGLAIAQAIVEWIVTQIKARTLFATHFHELTELDQVHPGIFNLSVGSIDRDGEVVFTHEICDGPANRSYGLEVARLAGLPPVLIKRAGSILSDHEAQLKEGLTARIDQSAASNQLSFFEPVQVESEYKERYESLRSRIDKIAVNDTSPLEALNILADVQEGLKDCD